jgi:flagellar biosynthesis/type III secretory pathway M-ring protein FliF/YscJ
VADRGPPVSRERRLAYAGAAVFVVLAAFAVLLWAREGNAVYFARIISDLPNCL